MLGHPVEVSDFLIIGQFHCARNSCLCPEIIVVSFLFCRLNTITRYFRIIRIRVNKELVTNKSQIDFLTKQLNPHFLFNTLNTIYGVSLKLPNKTSELILKVSELLRYQVENTKKDFIPIENEIDFIKSYIDLERERVGYRTEIAFSCEIDKVNSYCITSMLLFTFIENAFKHGTCNIEFCFVSIKICITDGILQLCTSNSVPLHKPEVLSTNVGLENTKQRLETFYPNRYELDIQQDDNKFDVRLVIKL